MNTHTTLAGTVFSAAFLAVLLLGCSDSSDAKSSDTSTSEPKADTSYLDELAAKQGIKLDDENNAEQAVDPVSQMDDAAGSDESDSMTTDQEQRQWEPERGSASLLGRSRDKGLALRDQIQGSTAPGQGLANTLSDEEYAAGLGLRWEMPEDWRMAVPPRGRFAEMYIQNRLGNASVSFTKETDSVRDIVRRLQGQIIDPMGGRSRAQTSDKTIAGYPVQIVDLEGTYLDPGSKGGTNEQIFYAMHAAIFDLGDARILIKMWGPQDTVNQSVGLFDTMIAETTKQ